MKKILIVEDNPELLSLMLEIVAQGGDFVVHAVERGLDAVGAASRVVPDLVLLDIMLPDIDGWDVFKHLRNSGMDIPVVFCSASVAAEELYYQTRPRNTDFIAKPFDPENLLQVINFLLAQNSTSPSISPEVLL